MNNSPITRIALVLKGYPRLSETFIAQEIYELEQRGLQITLISLRHPTDKKIHPVHEQIKAPVVYLPEYLYKGMGRVWKAFWKARQLPGYKQARRIFLKDLWRDKMSFVHRLRRWGQSWVVAAELPANIEYFYAHFLHTPASVTYYAATIRGLPWSCSAHARDIWISPKWELRDKLADLQWLSTCTKANYHYLRSLAKQPERINLVYHGLDFSRFPQPEPLSYSKADGSDADHSVKLISVGRTVKKKGYDVLLEALAALPKELYWHFTHIGGGSLSVALQQEAEQLGIAERITWLGAMEQTSVIQHYQQSDLFVLASRITSSGDRDGLPNVLMEAQSQGICCLSTDISGIPELIEQDSSGVMVPSEDVNALSVALDKLIREPKLRERLGRAGLKRVRGEFSVDRGIQQLMKLFGH